MSLKQLQPIKAQEFDDDELQAWFAGRIPRRLLAIPFGGMIPSAKSPRGVDLDEEWFSERTDLYGEVKALRSSPERLLDWHHGRDDLMRRTVIGKTILDPDPDEDGWWVDAWLKAGQRHIEMVRRLVERGAQLFGSSEAAYKKADPDTGEILVWPMVLETLTTKPTNTLSVLRPAKALLADVNDSGLTLSDGLASLISELDALSSHLSPSSAKGEESAKAGRDVVDAYDAAMRRLEESVKR